MSVRIEGPPPGPAAARLDRARLRRRAELLLREIGAAGSELSISLVDDSEMRALNHRWRNLPRTTDVLSFSLLEGRFEDLRGSLLGDVVISVDTAARQSRQRRRSLEETVTRLLIHGLLHIVGHDHARPAQARRMRAEEGRLWRALRD